MLQNGVEVKTKLEMEIGSFQRGGGGQTNGMDETVRKKAREERWARDTGITAVSMKPGRKDQEGRGKPENEEGK